MENNNFEIKEFKTDKNLIYHLIDSQKTDLKSALSELIQNSFDANATICKVNFNERLKIISIEDNGKGFLNKKEIEEFFGTFGTPHFEENSTKFGRFRIGRSQIFSLGSSRWRSKEFILNVDIRKKGLNYELIEVSEKQLYSNSTKIDIELYIPNDGDDFNSYDYRESSLKYSIQQKFKYLQDMELYFNGELINSFQENFANKKNVLEFNNFIFIDQGEHGLRGHVMIYNLGIFTKTIRAFPKLSGSIITKKHLKLDISRTEILPNDDIWSECEVFLKDLSKNKKNSSYSFETSKSVFCSLFSNKIHYSEIREIPLLREIGSGKIHTFNSIYNKKNIFCFSLYTQADNREKIYLDKLKQSGKVLILEFSPIISAWADIKNTNSYIIEDILREIKQFLQFNISIIMEKEDRSTHSNFMLEELNFLYKNLVRTGDYIDENEDHQIIEENDLTLEEKIILEALNKSNHLLISERLREKRKIVFGLSNESQAWTDGKSYIAINKANIVDFKKSKGKLFYIGLLLLHEYTHQSNQTDLHDYEFYNQFHNILLEENYDMGLISSGKFLKYGKKEKGLYHFYEGFWRVYYGILIKKKKTIPAFLDKYKIKKEFEAKKLDVWKKNIELHKENDTYFDVLKSYHTRLNKSPDLEDQLDFYKNFYNEMKKKMCDSNEMYLYLLEMESNNT
ncbi:hypothetical protein CMU89_07160 [Elizabethkingia anophelis]|nr:hypothetical protein [Elizabethkingia anophelis]MDV3542436.1 hypothetical protein [Elizabethkingia anophelis]